MPGYILHLTAAQMFLKTQKGQKFLKTKQDKNNFLIGNLLPDTTKIKARSHFRDPKYHDRMIEYPETSWFIKKYKHLLSNSSVVGYLFHLYIDRRFFKYYMPRIVEFRNAQDEREERRDIKTDRTKIIKAGFFLREILLWGLHKDEYVPCKSLSDSDNT